MKYLIICGPTCTGKTGLAVKLALRYDGEIVNADSRQIYKHTDIGTAKPSEDEQGGVRHYLFDILELSETFSAYQYAEAARDIIDNITSRNHLPIVVGGTGLYLKALTEGIFKSPMPDSAYREKLENIALNEGTEKLHSMLMAVDTIAGEKIKPRDKVRLIRALEIYHQTGLPISTIQEKGDYLPPSGQPLWIGLNYDRKLLYKMINQRVDNMISAGLEKETLDLEQYKDYIRKRKMIGYDDLIEYLYDKTMSRDEAIAKIKQHHRNYAKRQLTWFNKVENVNWFDPAGDNFPDEVYALADSYIKNT